MAVAAGEGSAGEGAAGEGAAGERAPGGRPFERRGGAWRVGLSVVPSLGGDCR